MAAYRLEVKPESLQLDVASYRSTSPFRPQSPPFLYDVPSISPPTSPKSTRSLISPTSPSFRTGTPPSNSRNRSITPSRIAQSDLEQFADHCRAWYFHQDDNAGRIMTQTMATLPQSQRAPYSRLQASIRSAYHRSISARKTAEFRAHLSSLQPGASLLPYSRANPHSSEAQKERYEKLERFIRNWCTMGIPGPQPFFRGLWALMRLQVVPEALGGAGGNRIEWEIDDAVFKEAAGKEFMLEAIDVLKGVLAFEEVPSSKSSPSPLDQPYVQHSRSISQPLPSDQKSPNTPQSKRPRAPSDPFLDTPALSRSIGTSSSHSSTLLTTIPSEDEPSSPISAYIEEQQTIEFTSEDPDDEFLRIWTSPDLSNPEYLKLLSLFPSFITRQTLPRFPTDSPHRDIDLEAVDELPSNRIRFGTGSLWVSSRPRRPGWQGSWWVRFILWLRRTFC